MSSNQPTKLPAGYYVVKGPKGHAVYANAVPELSSMIVAELRPLDAPDEILVRITPWRTTRYAAVTYFALNRLGEKSIHDAP